MVDATVIELDRLPAIVPTYLRAALTFSGGLAPGATIPDIECRVPGVSVDPDLLRRYAEVCAFPPDSDTAPITLPHVLAFPVHMAVLTHREFPLKLLGLVHVRNRITQHRAPAVGEALDLVVRVGGHRDVHNGIEFDMETVMADASGNTVWDSTSTMLSRGGGKGRRSGRGDKSPPSIPEQGRYGRWEAPADIGRRYAGVAGDVNPIHLSALSAKLFGFPRAIAHGMWLKGRTAAEIQAELPDGAHTLEVAFKRPVLLPGSVMLKYDVGETGTEFALIKPDSDTVHMTGSVRHT